MADPVFIVHRNVTASARYVTLDLPLQPTPEPTSRSAVLRLARRNARHEVKVALDAARTRFDSAPPGPRETFRDFLTHRVSWPRPRMWADHGVPRRWSVLYDRECLRQYRAAVRRTIEAAR